MPEQLVIITGPPGSGKSTVAQLVAERFERCALVRGDSFFGFVVRGYIDPWLPQSHDQNVVVTEAAARAAGRFPHGGYTTIYDGMVGPWFLRTFLEYCGLHVVHYAVLMPREDVCLARVLERVGRGFRDEFAARQMYSSFAGAKLDDRFVLADSSGAPNAVAEEVLSRFERGMLLYP